MITNETAKNIIYYFSATGNSLAVARKIANTLPDSQLLPMIGVLQEQEGPIKIEGKRVGFVFPTYYLGVPRVVKEFIGRLDAGSVEYVFAVATKGYPVVGAAISQIKQLLKNRGICLGGGFHVKSVQNDITFAQIPGKDEQMKILAAVQGQIEKILPKIADMSNYSHFEISRPLLNVRQKAYQKSCQTASQDFIVTEECNGCGICVRVCPLNNISLTESEKPFWGKKCQMCEACYNFCLKNAVFIETIDREANRYHHPDVSVKDMEKQKAV